MTETPLSDLETTDAAPPASNWRPTATSVAVVFGGTALLSGLLADATGLWKAVLPAVGGAALLALAVSLAAGDAHRSLSRFASAGLLVPASAAVLTGFGYALAKQLGGSYAVGSVFVVVGLAAAGFGAVAAVRDALDPEALASALAVAVLAALPPTLAFVPLALLRVSEAYAETLYFPVLVPDPVPAAAFPAAAAGGVLRFLVAPAHPGPHLFSFAVVCYVAAVGLAAVLRTYPVADLLLPRDPDAAARAVDPLERAATAAATFGLLVVLAAGVGFLAPDGFGALPARVLDLLTALAGVGVLRALLLVGGVGGVLLGAGSRVVRRLYGSRGSTGGVADAGEAVPSLAAGIAIVLGSFALHGPALSALVDAALGVLPSVYAAEFTRQTDAVIAFYGGEVVLLGLCAGSMLAAAVAFASLYAGLGVGAVTDRAAGAAVAGAGLFGASAVAATVGAGTPLVFAGLVAGLVVRDAGLHGVTLGEEVGRLAESRRAELVHLAATAAVGVGGAAFAFWLTGLLGRLPEFPGSAPALPVALGGAVLGVVLLAASLR